MDERMEGLDMEKIRALNKRIEDYRVTPQAKVHLRSIDPDDTSLFEGTKKEAEKASSFLFRRLDELQERLYINGKHKVLIVLQGMDTAGKDGTIRHIFSGVNPQGVKVQCFKEPGADELNHDFLWRIHKHVPAKGEIVIFNRSHYEDVLIVRVHGIVQADVCRSRYDHINAFERMLNDEGTIILKFYLHIDPQEQLSRIKKRLDKDQKHWKLSEADLSERKLWPEYINAYEETIQKTSTKWAPWYVIPANKKWYRNLTVACAIVKRLEKLNLDYPKANVDLSKLKKKLNEERSISWSAKKSGS